MRLGLIKKVLPIAIVLGLLLAQSSCGPAPPVLVSPASDGPAIVQNHCAKCHEISWLEAVEKSRLEWEVTLTQMEGMGAGLESSEKEALLDYFSPSE